MKSFVSDGARILRRRRPWPALDALKTAPALHAAAGITAGYAVATALGHAPLSYLIWLLLAGGCLHVGALLMRRALAEGGRLQDPLLGAGLTILGVLLAAQVTAGSAFVALGLAAAALCFAAWHGRPLPAGLWPGLLMGAGLVLGLHAAYAPGAWLTLPLLPAGVLLLNVLPRLPPGRAALAAAGSLALALTLALIALALLPAYSLLTAAPFIGVFAWYLGAPLARAWRGEEASSAAGCGAPAGILLMAALAAGFGGLGLGALVLALFPLSLWLE